MIEQKPPSAPPCWGRQYDDNDKECTNQCEYRVSCKPAFFRSNSTHGVTHLPMYPSQSAPFWQGAAPMPSAPVFPFQGAQQRTGTLPPPPTTFHPFPAPPVTMAMQQMPPAPMSVPPQIVQPPNHNTQQSVHSPYFMQYYSPYPGETVLQRLAKHVALRIGQVFFHELSNFLALWKWPRITK